MFSPLERYLSGGSVVSGGWSWFLSLRHVCLGVHRFPGCAVFVGVRFSGDGHSTSLGGCRELNQLRTKCTQHRTQHLGFVGQCRCAALSEWSAPLRSSPVQETVAVCGDRPDDPDLCPAASLSSFLKSQGRAASFFCLLPPVG